MSLGLLDSYILKYVLSPLLTIRSACRLKCCSKWLNAHVVDGVLNKHPTTALHYLSDMRFTREFIPSSSFSAAICTEALSWIFEHKRFSFHYLHHFCNDWYQWDHLLGNACRLGNLEAVNWLLKYPQYQGNGCVTITCSVLISAQIHVNIIRALVSSNYLNHYLVGVLIGFGVPDEVYDELVIYRNSLPKVEVDYPSKLKRLKDLYNEIK